MSYVRCLACANTTLPTLRGGAAFCSACGAPVAAPGLQVHGAPARVGGQIAGVLGWLLMGGGLFVGVVCSALAALVFDSSAFATLLVGTLVAVPPLAVGFFLRRGGQTLQRSGERSVEGAREQTLWSLASQREGRLTVQDAARGLGCPTEAADQLLTGLARRGDVRMDVDDDGTIFYLFGEAQLPPRARARVESLGASEGLDEAEPGPSARATRPR